MLLPFSQFEDPNGQKEKVLTGNDVRTAIDGSIITHVLHYFPCAFIVSLFSSLKDEHGE